MRHESRNDRVVARVYWWLLRCYPSSFRVAFGPDMLDTFVDRLRDAKLARTHAVIGFLISAFADAITNGFRERITVLTSGARMFHLMDVRYAFRLLRRSPVFSLLTMAVLAGGLAVSIFTFSFLNTAMVKPIPLSNGDRIVDIALRIGERTRGVDAADLAFMRSSIRSLSSLGAYYTTDLIVGDAVRRMVIRATATETNIFELSGARAALGRGFRMDDQQRGAEPVVVISDRTWKTRFGGDSTIVGSLIQVNGKSTRLIGVMPAGYGFPVASEGWVPINADVLAQSMPGHDDVDIYGQLANGKDLADAEGELNALLARAFEHDKQIAPTVSRNTGLNGEDYAKSRIAVRTFPMAQIGDEAPLILVILNALATLILMLACINVINLLLARANERARETAVRLALGATRARLIVQSMWEPAILCLAGGVLAVAMAAWGLNFINSWAQQNLSGNLAFWWVWGLDRSSLIAGIVFTTATIGVLGIAVSMRATSSQFTAVLNDGGARSGGRRQGRFARVLVVTQVATVSILMFFGVLSGIVAYRVANADMGYDSRNLLTTSIDLNDQRYRDNASRMAFVERITSELAATPAMENTLVRSTMADIDDDRAQIELTENRGAAGLRPRAYIRGIHGSMATLGIQLQSGRMFDSRDGATSARTALVSSAAAAKFWPGTSPIGHQVKLAGLDSVSGAATVVGVVSDVLFGNPLSRSRSAVGVYVPLAQNPSTFINIVTRYRGNANAGELAIYRALSIADPLMGPPGISSYNEILEKTTLIARSTAKLFGLCFGFALLLAVSGTYGLMARSIGQRSREIGVRRALGATEGNVTRLLLGQGTRQLGIGVVFALPIMAAIGFGFSRFFPIGVWLSALCGALVVATIVAVVITATYVPTRRVIVMPLRDALRTE